MTVRNLAMSDKYLCHLSVIIHTMNDIFYTVGRHTIWPY